jgi:hypothetical protein
MESFKMIFQIRINLKMALIIKIIGDFMTKLSDLIKISIKSLLTPMDTVEIFKK